jgi:hypothetical protein
MLGAGWSDTDAGPPRPNEGRVGYSESFNEIDDWCHELRRTHVGADLVRALEKRIDTEPDPERLQILNWFLAGEYEAQGNEAAVEAIRRRDPSEEIHRWHQEWQQRQPDTDIIPVLEDRIRRETHPSRLHVLRYFLANAHRDRGNYAASQAVFLADFEANPAKPMPLIFLAGQKLYYEEQPETAMPVIDRAVEVALRSGTFRRHALGVKARIALELNRHYVVEDVLRQIMALAFTRGNPDVGAERDILDRLPPGSIDPDVARAYDEYCRERGVLPKALEQHIDDLILSSAAAQWRKVAGIVSDVLSTCRRDKVDIGEYAIGKRVRFLVEHGKLQAKGELHRPRDSEVKLPD